MSDMMTVREVAALCGVGRLAITRALPRLGIVPFNAGGAFVLRREDAEKVIEDRCHRSGRVPPSEDCCKFLVS